MGRHTIAISIAAPLQYLLITVKVVVLKIVVSLLVIHKILRLAVNTSAVNNKLYLLNRDNLPQLIQIQLCQKQKIFSEIFFIFKIYVKF